MNDATIAADVQEREALQPADDEVQAWTEVEAGRFMPRRIRGSFRGGKLG